MTVQTLQEDIISNIAIEIITKDKRGPVVKVAEAPQVGAWFSLSYEGFWYRGHVTDLSYEYTSRAGQEATTWVTVTIDDTVWAEVIAEDEGMGQGVNPLRAAFIAGFHIGYSPNAEPENDAQEFQAWLDRRP